MPKTIKSYLSSVCSLHVDACLPFDSCESPTIQRVIRGIKHYYGERQRNPKMPITLSILQQLASIPGDLSLAGGADFDAVIGLAWAGFLRCGEFTLSKGEKFDPSIHLTRSSIEFIPNIFYPTHIRLVLPTSKTDPFRKGVAILISRAPSSAKTTCAVAALQHLFQLDPQQASSPLFLDSSGAPLSRNSFIGTLKSRLLRLGLDSSTFSGHSF